MIRLAALAALVLCACYPRVHTPYGTVVKPDPALVRYGNGAAGCWALDGLDEDMEAHAALAVQACRDWASEHGHRVLVVVRDAESMESYRARLAELFPGGAHSKMREFRGYVHSDRRFRGYRVVLSELAFYDGTWRALLEHELRHVGGETHEDGEDFE